jgi:hypothetical protein
VSSELCRGQISFRCGVRSGRWERRPPMIDRSKFLVWSGTGFIGQSMTIPEIAARVRVALCSILQTKRSSPSGYRFTISTNITCRCLSPNSGRNRRTISASGWRSWSGIPRHREETDAPTGFHSFRRNPAVFFVERSLLNCE